MLIFRQFVVIGLAFGLLVVSGVGVLGQEDDMRQEITEVFNAVRDGDFSGTDSLLRFGIRIIDATSPFLDDEDEDVRYATVSLIASINDARAASVLVESLADDDADVRETAAKAILEYALQSGSTGTFDPGDAIVNASAKGGLDGSSILLLGFSHKGLGILERASKGTHLVKIGNAGPAVPVSLAAKLALSRRGDTDARAMLEAHLANADSDTLLFVLRNIDYIASPSLLLALAAVTFESATPTGGGVPSDAEPSRRMMDEAVVAYVGRFSLRTNFNVRDTVRFKPEQIESVKKLVDRVIPQSGLR